MTAREHDSAHDDQKFLQAFENNSLPGEAFHHCDHVRVAWLCLHQGGLHEAIERFASGLRRFAALQGRPERFHESITWAFVLLIHERWQREPAQSWEEFARHNADLMSWSPSALDRYYRPGTLESEFARRVFVLPDAGVI